MAACDPFHFSGITADVFATVSKQLSDQGFPLAGPRGLVRGPFGIVIEYEWNEANGELVVHVVEKSFFVTCNQIREQLSGALGRYT